MTQSVRVSAQAAKASVKHLRIKGGLREVDLIVERPDQKVVAIEVKPSAIVNDEGVKNLLWLREQIEEDLMCFLNRAPKLPMMCIMSNRTSCRDGHSYEVIQARH